jgi:hypothetical protein
MATKRHAHSQFFNAPSHLFSVTVCYFVRSQSLLYQLIGRDKNVCHIVIRYHIVSPKTYKLIL